MKVRIFVRSTEHRKVKIYVVDCWGGPHPTLEKHSLLAEKFNKIDVINLLISLYLEVLGLTSKCSQ
ncbi:hypothetical protein T03_7213 [Trichinella britovi]|uniref:Uncharacterized protein n=1 Tax=Trichinella britovi TaxID=45882 RepID=A0A0V1D3R8_TRIBR|nr:hypothetical protein T03_7213 [Trichinella britovi]